MIWVSDREWRLGGRAIPRLRFDDVFLVRCQKQEPSFVSIAALLEFRGLRVGWRLTTNPLRLQLTAIGIHTRRQGSRNSSDPERVACGPFR
ncbi:hypothetical protein MARPO_0221s0010 [Marchantia polymorpha]|uniref:Uncharacterized protein n=1 Tax=Marchantia polymorpha TaxID=3197 RepID=A0A2R6VZT3_MARPO|nr:hypothetical protein MARPO_0221s0010 [Marchantia polymorpha]|eukprot:PTQ27115.1 hypothetical protein MARPO_0221s0010 [Marchantia polymorpha]